MHREEDGKVYYVTSNFSLCGYLEIQGLRFVKADISKGRNNKFKVDFYFLDPDKRGQDLEIEFRYSNEKKYKEALFFYRKKINELLGT